MKIYVCVKRVPHTAAKIRLAAAAGTATKCIQSQGIEFALGPYDEIALAEAIKIKERAGGGEVVAVSLGGDESQTILRTALAVGADAAVHLRAPAALGLELDGFQVASALASFLKERGFDLLCFGRLAGDDQSAQVGVQTARLLRIPVVANTTKVELGEGCVQLHHVIDGRVEVVNCKLPAALTAQKGLAEAPYPSIKQIMAARKKTIEVVEALIPAPTLEVVALEPPPPRRPGSIVGQGVAAVPALVKLLREEAKVL